MKLFFLFSIIYLFVISSIQAATYTTQGVDLLWSNLNNWDDGLNNPALVLPGAGDDIILIHPIDVDVNATVASITYSADWAVLNIKSNIALTVSGNITSITIWQ